MSSVYTVHCVSSILNDEIYGVQASNVRAQCNTVYEYKGNSFRRQERRKKLTFYEQKIFNVFVFFLQRSKIFFA